MLSVNLKLFFFSDAYGRWRLYKDNDDSLIVGKWKMDIEIIFVKY